MNALAWALLDFVWQGALVGCIAALVLGLLRTARPQTRYAVACAALLLCAALPLAGTLQRMIYADGGATTLLPLALAGDPVAAIAPTLSTDRLANWQQSVQARLPLVMLLWSAGAATLALRMLLGLLWVRRRSQPSRSRADPAWQARVARLAGRMGITRPVRLGLVDDLPSPVTAGWWRPVILLPASLASGMPVDLLEALLAHELAHIRRHDYWSTWCRAPSRSSCFTTLQSGGCRAGSGSNANRLPMMYPQICWANRGAWQLRYPNWTASSSPPTPTSPMRHTEEIS